MSLAPERGTLDTHTPGPWSLLTATRPEGRMAQPFLLIRGGRRAGTKILTPHTAETSGTEGATWVRLGKTFNTFPLAMKCLPFKFNVTALLWDFIYNQIS